MEKQLQQTNDSEQQQQQQQNKQIKKTHKKMIWNQSLFRIDIQPRSKHDEDSRPHIVCLNHSLHNEEHIYCLQIELLKINRKINLHYYQFSTRAILMCVNHI